MKQPVVTHFIKRHREITLNDGVHLWEQKMIYLTLGGTLTTTLTANRK